jgi:hypothetical protein
MASQDLTNLNLPFPAVSHQFMRTPEFSCKKSRPSAPCCIWATEFFCHEIDKKIQKIFRLFHVSNIKTVPARQYPARSKKPLNIAVAGL